MANLHSSMLPTFSFLAAIAIGLTLAGIEVRRFQRNRLRITLSEVQLAKSSGSHRARLQYPWIDLSRCIGCGTCVQACPEEGVLQLLHGQAAVVHGSRCVGHGRCAEECPVGGIALTLGDLGERKDIPVLADLESPSKPGLFLAGEVTGYALIRTAVGHGKRVAQEIHRRIAQQPNDSEHLDLCVIGAGPAGITCALEAKRLGLNFVALEQESLGGTVAKYPRQKLVMTQPLDFPLGSRLRRDTYQKEELMDFWHELHAEHELPIKEGVVVNSVGTLPDGSFELETSNGRFHARFVCLALGRRGTPRKLGVPGEELPKVTYSLVDAQAYRGRKVLIVGGGDSAIEAALGLARQPGNVVHISYRREAFFRLKARNELGMKEALRNGKIKAHFSTRVVQIKSQQVSLQSTDEANFNSMEPTEGALPFELENDEVFVLAGGIPPFPFLQSAGVSFDPALRPSEPVLEERGSGIRPALYLAFVCCIAVYAFFQFNRQYYDASAVAKLEMEEHSWLRSSRGFGLFCGFGAVGLMLANLAYLVRRSPKLPFQWGNLRAWMTAHVGTGILALLLALLHSTFTTSSTVGSHALQGLVVLVLTGSLGRYFYSYVPRAANGRELALDEAVKKLQKDANNWSQVHRGFGEEARQEISSLIERTRWKRGFWGSVSGVLGSKRQLKKTLSKLRAHAQSSDVDPDAIEQVLEVARQAYHGSLAATHLENLNALLASWRYLHRWVALLVVLLVAAHVWSAYRFAQWGAVQ